MVFCMKRNYCTVQNMPTVLLRCFKRIVSEVTVNYSAHLAFRIAHCVYRISSHPFEIHWSAFLFVWEILTSPKLLSWKQCEWPSIVQTKHIFKFKRKLEHKRSLPFKVTSGIWCSFFSHSLIHNGGSIALSVHSETGIRTHGPLKR